MPARRSPAWRGEGGDKWNDALRKCNMHRVTAFLLLSVAPTLVLAQRVVVTPGREAIPLAPEESSVRVAEKIGLIQQMTDPVWICTGSSVLVGQIPGWVEGINFGFFDGDVALLRMMTPITGVIESLYFQTFNYGLDDSSCSIRIFESAFTPSNPEPLGTVWLGYYSWPPDTNGSCIQNDPYSDTPGIAGWVVGDSSASPWGFDPNGPELWGNGGFLTTWHPYNINGVAMADLGNEPQVEAGDYFNVCLRLPPQPVPDPDRNELEADSEGLDPADFLKYYYRGRLSCTDVGWWARVDFNVRIWALIRGGVGISIENISVIPECTTTGEQTVTATILDTPPLICDLSAWLWYSVNGLPEYVIPMTQDSASQWSAQIPGQPPGTSISYWVTASNECDDTISCPGSSYIVHDVIPSLNQFGYVTDTAYTYSFDDITTSGGTSIPGGAFFDYDGITQDEDDGTAGPFDLGGEFQLFGVPLRYAWIGANGAIGLSSEATDTIHMNAGGWFTLWSIPETDLSFPMSFIGAFWNDLYLAPGGRGSVWYKSDGTRFTVQYDEVGNFNDPGDFSTFQIILDYSDQSIIFQYRDVGTTGLDETATVGLQVDPDTAWLEIHGGCVDMRPRNEWAVKMIYTGVNVDENDQLPIRFALYQNFPNPFNPTTTITFEIPTRPVGGSHSSLVVLKIYDLLGREVTTLVSEKLVPGRYQATFDGTQLSSGVYFYRLQAEGLVQTKRMVLIR